MTVSISAPWIRIQVAPTPNSSGCSTTARRFMCMPMLATSTYSISEPTFEAPAPSSLRAGVSESSRPKVVASTTIQKNSLVSEICSAHWPWASKNATSGPASACDSPVKPKPTAAMKIRSGSFGMRACCCSNCSTLRRSATSAVVSAPRRRSNSSERPAR